MRTPQHLEHLPLESLTPYPHNSRTHSAAQVAEIAASMKEFGWTDPILIDEGGMILAGHGRQMAAQQIGVAVVPCVRITGLSEAQKRAYVIADNRLTLNGGWDLDTLRGEVGALLATDFEISVLGFDDGFLADLIGEADDETAPPPDPVPPVPKTITTLPGDVWQLGPHRVACGDATDPALLAALIQGRQVDLVHADPPYGMGKAKDGVQNDNLYQEKLDAFQLKWWRACRPYVSARGSAYIWGNAPDLWRLWYAAGLADSEALEVRNEIVWDKMGVPGMASSAMTQFPEATERCLFFQIGEQNLGNVNSWNFPETWAPIQDYLAAEGAAVGLTPARCREVTGKQMYSHWFTRSQFQLIQADDYAKLAVTYPGHFATPWPVLRQKWDLVRDDDKAVRAYFDNSHDIMRDVWTFDRVVGEERYGHATPKPVAMMERAIRSSCPAEGLVFEPFLGTGPTLLAAERSGRVCYGTELTPEYVDIVVTRWQAATYRAAVLEGSGRTFDEVGPERQA